MPSQLPGPPPDMEIPDQLQIKPSVVDPDALGLWCKKIIRTGTKFGPFMGNKVQEATDDMDPSYVWEIVDLETKEFLFYIDATDPGVGNWMRYINCARFFEEQNIVSEQEGIDIVYRAIKDIHPGEELLTWYERAPLRRRRGKKARKTVTSTTTSRVSASFRRNSKTLSRSSSTDSQLQQPPQPPQPPQQQQQQQQEIKPPQPQESPETETPPIPSTSSSASLNVFDLKEPEEISEFTTKDSAADDNQPLRRSKRKCPKSSAQDDDFIYGSDNDHDDEDEDDDDDEDDVDDEDDINEEDGESFNGSIPDVFQSDNIDSSQPVSDSAGFYQFEVKPYHNVKSRLGRKVFQCDICSGVYRHTFSLKRHYIRNHINYKFVSKTDRLNCNVNYNDNGDNMSNSSSALQDKDPSPPSLSDGEEACSVKTMSSISPTLGEQIRGKLEGVGDATDCDDAVVALGVKSQEKQAKKNEVESEGKTENNNEKVEVGAKVNGEVSSCVEVLKMKVKAKDEGAGPVEKEETISGGNCDKTESVRESPVQSCVTDGKKEDDFQEKKTDIDDHVELEKCAESVVHSKVLCNADTSKNNTSEKDAKASKESCADLSGDGNLEPNIEGKAPSGDCRRISDACKTPSGDCEPTKSDCKVPPGDCKEQSSESTVPSGDCKDQSSNCTVPSGECKVQNSECKVLSSDHKERSGDCKVPSGDCKEQSSDCKVPCGDCKEHSNDCKVPSGDCKDQSSDSTVPSGDVKDQSSDSTVPSGNCKDQSSDTTVPSGDCKEQSSDCKVPSGDCKEGSSECKGVTAENCQMACGDSKEQKTDCKVPLKITPSASCDCKEPSDTGTAPPSKCTIVSDACKVTSTDCEKFVERSSTKEPNSDKTCAIEKKDSVDNKHENTGSKEVESQATSSKTDREQIVLSLPETESKTTKSEDNAAESKGTTATEPEPDKVCGQTVTTDLLTKPTTDNSAQLGIDTQPKIVPEEAASQVHSGIPELPEVTQSEIMPSSSPKVAGLMPGVFRCNICEALFDTIPELKVHLQHHPDVPSTKKFACNQCDMKFSHKQNLMRHQAVHSGTKPYICKFCGKKFPTVTNLKRHERVHQGRRFSCERCGATFSQTGDLKKHIRKVHPDIFHECGFCSKYYADTEQLVEHLDLVHPGEDFTTNNKELSMKSQVFKVDSKKDRAESMRIALAKPGHRFACTICKKRFHDYANMCRHRRLAHQRQVLLSRRLVRTPEITMETLYGSFTDGDCMRPNGEFDFPSQYYANVARNISENLTTYLEGKQDELKHPDNHIKWKESKPDTDSKEVVKSTDKKRKDEFGTGSLMKYNFPRGFQFKPSADLWKKKVNYFVASPEKLLEEKVEVEVGAEDTEETTTNLDTKVEDSPPEPLPREPSPAHSQKANTTEVNMKSPPPLQRKPVATPTIRVPKLHTCGICNCVLHNFGLYRQHMSYKHKIQIADHTPDLLEHVPGLQPKVPSSPSTLETSESRREPNGAPTVAPCTTKAHSPRTSTSVLAQPPHRLPGPIACPTSPPAHSACARSPPAHCSSSASTSGHYPLSKTPVAHLSSAVSPPAHSSTATSPLNHTEQPLDLSSPKIRYPPINPFDPVPSGAINLTLDRTDAQNLKNDVRGSSTEPVDLTDSPPKDKETISNTSSAIMQPNEEASKQTPKPKNEEESKSSSKCGDTNPETKKKDTAESQTVKKVEQKKVINSKYICLACYEEFAELTLLHEHQSSAHPTLDCRHGSRLEMRPGMKAMCCSIPNAVGMLNVCTSQVPEQKENTITKPVSCTKCNKTYPTVADLHQHIIDFCANDGKPEEVYYGYIWIYRGKIRAKKRRKYRRPQNTPRKHGNVFSVYNQRRRGIMDSAEDEEDGRRKRRRGMYELLYNPLNHIRRREMAEIVDTLSCRGCGDQFKTISMLERHIPVCSHKDRLREIHVGKSQLEEDEDSDAYDPTKHMCIYCERLFTYMGMLRNHILDICPVRKDFVEQGELLDDEWEQDIISKAGPRETLSRQSSMSSLLEHQGEDGENPEEEPKSSKRGGKKRKKKRHNWGYRVKNGERRQSKNSEEGDSSMSPGGAAFTLQDESSSSMGLPSKEESLSNGTEVVKENDETAHFSAVRTKSEGLDTSATEGYKDTAITGATDDAYDEETENSDNETELAISTPKEKSLKSPNKSEPIETGVKGNKRKLSVEGKKTPPTKKAKIEKSSVESMKKTPKKTPSKTPSKMLPKANTAKGKSPVKKTVGATPKKTGTKPSKSLKAQLEDSGVGDEDVDSDDEDVVLSMLVASPKSADEGSLPSPKSPTKKTPAKSSKTAATPKLSQTAIKKLAKSPIKKSAAKIVPKSAQKGQMKAKSPVKKAVKSPAKSAKKATKKPEVVKKFMTRRQSWAATTETTKKTKSPASAAKAKGGVAKGGVAKGKKRAASVGKSAAKSQTKSKDSCKEKPPSLSSVKKKLKL